MLKWTATFAASSSSPASAGVASTTTLVQPDAMSRQLSEAKEDSVTRPDFALTGASLCSGLLLDEAQVECGLLLTGLICTLRSQ